jgi:hypothetical protein
MKDLVWYHTGIFHFAKKFKTETKALVKKNLNRMSETRWSILISFKVQFSRFSTIGFFHQTIPSRALIHGINPFRIWLRIRRENRLYSNFSGVIDTAATEFFLPNFCSVNYTTETISAVSMTPLKLMRHRWNLKQPLQALFLPLKGKSSK